MAFHKYVMIPKDRNQDKKKRKFWTFHLPPKYAKQTRVQCVELIPQHLSIWVQGVLISEDCGIYVSHCLVLPLPSSEHYSTATETSHIAYSWKLQSWGLDLAFIQWLRFQGNNVEEFSLDWCPFAVIYAWKLCLSRAAPLSRSESTMIEFCQLLLVFNTQGHDHRGWENWMICKYLLKTLYIFR